MDKVVLGRTGLKVSPLCVGAWELGPAWGAGSSEAATVAIHVARERGVNCFDIAPDLGFGTSEQLVGSALDEELHENRDDLVIATEGGFRREGDRIVRDASPERLREEVDASRRALGIDAIDLFQVHLPDAETPVGETADALAELVDEGKIEHAGVATLATGSPMLAFAEHDPLETVQTTFHMFRRGLEGFWLPYFKVHHIGVLIDGPRADGLLTGAMTPSSVFGAGDWHDPVPDSGAETVGARRMARMRRPPKGGTTRPVISRPGYGFGRPTRPNPDRGVRAELETVDRLQRFAAERNLSLPELAVAWTLATPGVDVAIVGAGSSDQLQMTLGAGDVQLSHRDRAEIDQILG